MMLPAIASVLRSCAIPFARIPIGCQRFSAPSPCLRGEGRGEGLLTVPSGDGPLSFAVICSKITGGGPFFAAGILDRGIPDKKQRAGPADTQGARCRRRDQRLPLWH